MKGRDNLLKANQQVLNSNKPHSRENRLPEIGANKFSSWHNKQESKTSLNEFDDLMKEHDLLLGGSANKNF